MRQNLFVCRISKRNPSLLERTDLQERREIHRHANGLSVAGLFPFEHLAVKFTLEYHIVIIDVLFLKNAAKVQYKFRFSKCFRRNLRKISKCCL